MNGFCLLRLVHGLTTEAHSCFSHIQTNYRNACCMEQSLKSPQKQQIQNMPPGYWLQGIIGVPDSKMYWFSVGFQFAAVNLEGPKWFCFKRPIEPPSPIWTSGDLKTFLTCTRTAQAVGLALYPMQVGTFVPLAHYIVGEFWVFENWGHAGQAQGSTRGPDHTPAALFLPLSHFLPAQKSSCSGAAASTQVCTLCSHTLSLRHMHNSLGSTLVACIGPRAYLDCNLESNHRLVALFGARKKDSCLELWPFRETPIHLNIVMNLG